MPGPGRKRLSPSSLMPSRPFDDTQRAALPIRGQALRHSYSTVAVDLKIDDLIRHFLMGHAPKAVSQDYVALSMREAQEQISKRLFSLLGLSAKSF